MTIKRTVRENNTDVVLPGGETYSRAALSEVVETANAGGTTLERPAEPVDFQSYFDTTLGLPIFWTGAAWVNASGADPDLPDLEEPDLQH
jgi:hypothetical protein